MRKFTLLLYVCPRFAAFNPKAVTYTNTKTPCGGGGSHRANLSHYFLREAGMMMLRAPLYLFGIQARRVAITFKRASLSLLIFCVILVSSCKQVLRAAAPSIITAVAHKQLPWIASCCNKVSYAVRAINLAANLNTTVTLSASSCSPTISIWALPQRLIHLRPKTVDFLLRQARKDMMWFRHGLKLTLSGYVGLRSICYVAHLYCNTERGLQ